MAGRKYHDTMYDKKKQVINEDANKISANHDIRVRVMALMSQKIAHGTQQWHGADGGPKMVLQKRKASAFSLFWHNNSFVFQPNGTQVSKITKAIAFFLTIRMIHCAYENLSNGTKNTI